MSPRPKRARRARRTVPRCGSPRSGSRHRSVPGPTGSPDWWTPCRTPAGSPTTPGSASRGASAVAAAVSAGIDGATRAEALDVAVAAARIGETRGHWVAGGSIADRTEWARGHLATVPDAERIDVVSGLIGTSVASQESVVAALALVALDLDPWRTVCTAASIGGDTDTIAAMAGAVLGAVHGAVAWSADAVHQVETVNDLHLEELTERLLDLRTGPGR
ncbi:ADP-ribosylglycohydrolase family protein [Curtobacterium sp. MCJR17_043]|uniref:ADP-ribosylglycohydrolase family protein n=1 Tax=Curtobacterium sp. MCJR17_043 TaxID=2175660 RepID=UPI0032E8594B